MPKASLNPDKAQSGGGGVEAGNFVIVLPRFQNLKTDFRQNQLYLAMECGFLDKDGDPVRGADPVDINLSFGKKSLEAFTPGNASGADDSDPENLGDAVDVEGNTVYCSGDEQFNKSAGALVFMESLSKAGFPKSVLDRCYAPDMEGLKFTMATMSAKDINEKFGMRLNTKPMIDETTKEERPVTYKVVTKWLNPNFLSKDGKKAKDGAKGADKSDDGADTKPAKLTDPEEIAKHVLGLVAGSRAGEKGKIKTKAQLVGFFTNEYARSKQDPKKLSECQKMVKDDDWIIGAIAELGGTFDEGVTTFPEAE